MLSESLLNAFHTAMPGLEIHERADSVLLVNRVLGTRVEGPKQLMQLVRFFERPRRLADSLAGGLADPESLLLLLQNAIVLDVALAFADASAPIGDACALGAFLALEGPCEIAIFGAPTDSATSGEPGTRHGPAQIRKALDRYPWSCPARTARLNAHLPHLRAGSASGGASILDIEMRRVYGAKPKVLDLGDLVFIAGESSDTFGQRAEWLIDLVLRQNAKPAMLGGDHSLTHYALRAIGRKYESFGIIHFDAHHDTYPSPFDNVVTHGNFLSAGLKGSAVAKVLQIGLRTVEWANSELLVADRRVEYVSAREVQTMSPADVFKGLPRDIPYYFTFDIDCMAPHLASDTGTPVAGGLTYYQALDLVDYAANHFTLAGFDIVEVGGVAGSTARGAADVAARMLFSLLLGKVPFEPLDTYLQPTWG